MDYVSVMESLAYWRGRLDQARRRVTLLRLAEVAAAFLAAAAIWLAVFTAVDRAWRLPPACCWCAWAGGVGVLLATGVALMGVLRRRWQDSALALLIERGLPEVDNRLVNAVQLAESADPAARAVAAQLLEELRARHPEPRFYRIHPAGRLAGLAMAAALATLLLGVLYLVDPPATAQSWRRALFPVRGEAAYAATRVLRVLPGDTAVRRGDPWSVQACIGGKAPAGVVLEFAGQGGESWTQAMTVVRKETLGGAGTGVWWEWSVPSAVLDGRYRVLAGDDRSSWFRLELALPPVLAAWKAVVEPPAYTHLPTVTLDRQAPSLEVPAGAKVTLEGRGGTALTRARLLGDGAREWAAAPAAGEAFSLTWIMPDGGGLAVELTDRHKLTGISPLPLRPMPDAPPRVQWWETRGPLVATPSAGLAPGLLAMDDYGVARIGLQLLPDIGPPRDVVTQDAVGQAGGRQWRSRLKLELAPLGLRPGTTVRLRGFAEDYGPRAAARRAFTSVLEIRLEDRRDLAQERRGQAQGAQATLAELIQWQRDNLRETRRLAEAAAAGGAVAEAPVRAARAVQEKIRSTSVQLATQGAALGEVAVLLAELADGAMTKAVASLDAAGAAPPGGRGQALHQADMLENGILARLTGGADSLAGESRHQEKTDLLTLLRRLADGQRQTLTGTHALAKQPEKTARAGALLLARRQDALATELTAFEEQAADLLLAPGDEAFAGRLRQARELLNKVGVYEAMLAAAEALEAAEAGRAAEQETLALKGLFQALDILNRWAVENAKQEAAAAVKTIAAVDDALGKLERQQAKIVETTRALAAKGALDDAARKELAAMDAEQKPMADLVEKLAQDLYQFPDLPVCNELNSRMREIFEDVQQAANSADAPSMEIAVQKEDSLLEAIRNTKERVKDVEMWLPNIPDNIVWNMESFDADEFPNMPLVPLPDELEDIVGDLLEQAQSIAEQSQDTTGNNMMADGEMGWGIMDGPMPSFGAKGKSGNMRPNDNEMTGRSGAGREGQSNGEMVEDQAKGLEGTEAKARRTHDAFQKGQVNEAADSTLDARATGGGKVGGQSESAGMFGQAPRRDAYVGDHAPNPVALRQEAEALYTRSRLLYLGTGGLDEVTRELRKLEAARQLPAFAPLARKVLRELEQVRIGGDGGTVLEPSLDGRETRGGATVQDVDLGQIRDDAYREMVEHYFRDLDAK